MAGTIRKLLLEALARRRLFVFILFFQTNNTPTVQLCFLILGFLGPSVWKAASPF